MPNTNAKRDADYVPVMLGTGDNGETLPVKIDSITGRILAEIYSLDDSSTSVLVNRALHDNNHVPTIIGASDADDTPLAVAMDSRNNYLFADLLIEP